MFSFAETPLNLKLNPQYYGRWLIEDSVVRTSSPGAAIQFSFEGTEVFAEIEGDSYWKVEIDDNEYPDLLTSLRKKYTIIQGLPAKKHVMTLTRKSECTGKEIRLYSILLGANGIPKTTSRPNNRRLEFIGDSYTVGYGNEASNPSDGEPFSKTNTTKSFAYLLAKSFRADFQINAFSGRGLVRNYGNMIPEWTIPKLYEYTIPAVVVEGNSPKWNFSWHPQVIVIFVGINDWQGAPPFPSAAAFDKAYAKLLNTLRSQHPGVQFLLLATHVWPSNEMIPRVQAVFDNEIKNGYKDVTFMEVYTENTALDGHPSLHAHENLANQLRPVIGRLGKWLSR